MSEPTNPLRDHDLTTLLSLGIPAAIVVTLFLEVRGPEFNLWALTAYAAFLGTYLCWIFGYEYIVFRDLHMLKSRPTDTVLLAVGFLAILQVSRTAGAVDKALLWLGIHSAALVAWEAYTMACGYERYFGLRAYGAHFTVLDLVRRPPTEDPASDRRWHWQEYRYWILLDGAVCLAIGMAWAFRAELLKALPSAGINLVISAIGFTIGLINTLRHALLARRIRALIGIEKHT